MAADESRLKCYKNDLKTSVFYSYLAETEQKWKPVGLTFVEYPEGLENVFLLSENAILCD